MARTPTGRPRGRPVGTRTATVELETVSFKAPKAFVERVKRYAKQHLRPVSELVRDGLEWRLGEGDPLNMRFRTATGGETAGEGNTGNTDITETSGEGLHGMLSALVAEVRQLHNAVQALEQRLGRTESVDFSGNTYITTRKEDVPGQAVEPQPSLREKAHEELVEAIGEDTRQTDHGVPPFDPSTHTLGPLCKYGHDHEGTGQSLRRRKDNECLECQRIRQREHRQRQCQAGSRRESAI